MIKIDVKFKNQKEAIELVREACKIPYDVNFTNGKCFVDAKSVLGVLSSDLSGTSKLIILAKEDDVDVQNFIFQIKDCIVSMEVVDEKY